MKVLIITNLYLSRSATLHDRNLILGLHDKGVEVTVITRGQTPETKELETAGVRFVYHAIIRKIDFRSIRKIRSLIKEENYDILHFTYGKAITNGLIASAGHKAKIVAYLGSMRLHWHDPFSYISFLNHRIDKLICISDAVKEHVVKQAPLKMKNRAVRIFKGSDPDWFKEVIPARRADLGIPEDAFIVCCVANIRKIKGLGWLISSARYIPGELPVKFLVVGSQTDSEDVRKKIEKTGRISDFITIGYSEDPTVYTALCDLYVQPSVSEGFGRSVMEAMCLEKPVVVTDKGGAKELVKEGVTGFIIPVKSAKAIADKILFCYRNRSILKEMGRKGKESIINEFNHRSTIEETYKLYEDLLRS
jgi:L-malate glycosyltransferase